jgi:diamine N-acetyltransferase
MTITLREITRHNWEDAAQLKVHEGQRGFVAPNWYSMLEAVFSEGELHSRGIYLDDSLVGYAMYGIHPETKACWIVRLMTDKAHQGKGYGRSAMALILDQIKTRYACNEIFISFNPANSVARKFYESIGFVDTGEIEDDELVFRLALES